MEVKEAEAKEDPDFTASYSITTTTTEKRPRGVQVNKIRGFSLDILQILNDCGGQTVIEISNKLQKKPVYTTQYLNNLRDYGYIFRNHDWKWYLSSPLDNSILNLIYNDKRKIKEESKKDKRKIKETRQFTLQPWQSGRSEFEVVVVEYLLKHFHETNSKWLWKEDMDPEKMGIPPTDLNKAIRKLLRDKIMFKFKDPDYRILKFGLTDFFLEGYQYI